MHTTPQPTRAAASLPSRRSIMAGAAWAVPTMALVGAAPAFAASPGCLVSWWERSTLVPGERDVTRDKLVTDGGDVAIDGWTSATGVPSFRVVAGTLVALRDVVATISVTSGNLTASAPSAAYTPARGATPADYKVVPVAPLTEPVAVSTTQFTWNLGVLPGGSSAGFDFTGTPAEGNTAPFVVEITLTGTKAEC